MRTSRRPQIAIDTTGDNVYRLESVVDHIDRMSANARIPEKSANEYE